MGWRSFQQLDYLFGCIVSGSPLVDKDNDLLAHFQDSQQIVENDVIHDIVAPVCITHLLDAVEGAL